MAYLRYDPIPHFFVVCKSSVPRMMRTGAFGQGARSYYFKVSNVIKVLQLDLKGPAEKRLWPVKVRQINGNDEDYNRVLNDSERVIWSMMVVSGHQRPCVVNVMMEVDNYPSTIY